MASREYGVDVAIYQSANMQKFKNAGAKYAIVKLTEGTGYFNPLAVQQTTNARNAHMYVHAYHFANFGNSVARAKSEAAYFLKHAKECNMAKSRYLWLDWEGNTYNYVNGAKSANTAAIMAFMRAIKKAGYKTGLYSGAALMRSNIDTKAVIKEFGNCLWVASYPVSEAVSSADFNYFPSMDGVAVWQFTDNWKGLNVDGNISVIDLHTAKKASSKATKKPAKVNAKANTKTTNKPLFKAYAPIINNDPNWKIALRDGNGKLTGKYIKTNSTWLVWEKKDMKGGTWYRLGTNQQWAPANCLKIKKV